MSIVRNEIEKLFKADDTHCSDKSYILRANRKGVPKLDEVDSTAKTGHDEMRPSSLSECVQKYAFDRLEE